MAFAPAKPCIDPHCPHLQPCPVHAARKPFAHHGSRTTTQQGYGWRWQQLVVQVKREEPYCRACRTQPTTQVDHMIPKAAGGTDARSNLQGLCASCHRSKTARVDSKPSRPRSQVDNSQATGWGGQKVSRPATTPERSLPSFLSVRFPGTPAEEA